MIRLNWTSGDMKKLSGICLEQKNKDAFCKYIVWWQYIFHFFTTLEEDINAVDEIFYITNKTNDELDKTIKFDFDTRHGRYVINQGLSMMKYCKKFFMSRSWFLYFRLHNFPKFRGSIRDYIPYFLI